MEARVTTATRRLRRASVAGLATIATAGVAVLASGGTALAFVTATSAANAAVVTAGSSATLSVGASNQALGDVTLKFPANASAEEYSAGEQITFTLRGAGPTHVINDTSVSAFNTAAFAAAPTVTADNGVAAPAAGVALATTTQTNDSFVVTFNANAPENSTATTFTISNLKVNLGSTVSPGQTISLRATATTGTNLNAFWTGAAANNESVVVGTIPQVNVTASKVAVSAPAATGVALGVISIKDVAGGSIHSGDALVLTPSSGAFTTVPTAAGTPAVGTVTIVGGALHFTASAASVAGNTISLTGAVITAGAAGGNTATLTDTTNAFGINPTVKIAAAVNTTRLGGSDRYGTGSLVFAAGAYTATSVVLTSGANFPDALSA
jgi:hypothetical protein